jgi:hypothetical protein
MPEMRRGVESVKILITIVLATGISLTQIPSQQELLAADTVQEV